MHPAPRGKRSPCCRAEVYLCLFLFAGLSLTISGHGTFVDENLVIQTVESLVTRGELTVTQMFQALPGLDGRYYSRYGISFPLLLIPFYLLGYGLDWLFPHTHVFYGNPHFFMLLWGNQLVTVLTGWLFYRLGRVCGGSIRTSVWLTIALIFATPYWPYNRTLFRLTAASAVLLAILYLVLLQLRTRSLSRFFLVSITFLTAFGLNLREDLVLGMMAIGVFVLCRGAKNTRWAIALAMIGGAAAGVLIWGWHNWIRFGSFFIENYEDLSFNYPLVLSLPQLLVGLRRGLIVYAPLCLLLPFSFRAAWRKGKGDIWFLCAGILTIYLFLYAKSDMWHGGRCWGPRHMYFLLPFGFLPGIWWLEDFANIAKRWFFVVATGIGIVMNWPGVYAHQGKYQDFFSSPSFFSLLVQPIVHPEYITFDELDLWWIRAIKMEPFTFFLPVYVGTIVLTVWLLFRLIRTIRQCEREEIRESEIPSTT